MKTTTIRLPDELLKAAKIHAVKTGTTLQDLVAEALTAVLKGHQHEEGRA